MLLKFLTPNAAKEVPRFDRSRCLRMRHRNSGCDLCRQACRHGAIDSAAALRLDEEKCSSCFACTAVCPTEALVDGDFDWATFLSQNITDGSAVVGCAASRAGIRAPLPCIGLLAEPHLTALVLSGKGEIDIDIEPCAACANGEMVQVLKDRLAKLPKLLSGRVLLVAGREALPPAGRREFFAALKNTVLREVAAVRAGDEAVTVVAYSEKQLPLKRKLLNEALQSAAVAEREELKKTFYFNLEVDASCTFCTACSAVCPTGALKRRRDEKGLLLQFSSAACPGCRLCAASCRKNAIRLNTADPQTDVFAWQTLCREKLTGTADHTAP